MTLRLSSLALAAAAAVVSAGLTVPGAVGAAPGSAPSADGSSAEAKAALRTVRSIFTSERAGGRDFGQTGEVPDATTVDATMALRDLALAKDRLTGDDLRAANSFLARPTDPAGPNNPDSAHAYSVAEAPPVCNTDVCVHYVATTNDAPPMGDANTNGTPDYVEGVLATVTSVHDRYVAGGYRSPKPDGVRGGTDAIDIYIADIGDGGLYGYCTTDQNIPRNGPHDVWAYCVLDDDYAASEFPTNTPTKNLQVTAAHEFFHAVQYAYDVTEDHWFLEATAAWVEDELYDDVNDNLQYLSDSPLRQPDVPLDTFGGSFHYGTWIFFRYLSERFPAAQGGMPTIVRDMIRRVDGSQGAPDQYSMQAVKSVLKARGQDFPKLFAKFSNANRRPKASYSEGRANKYKSAPLAKRYRLGKGAVRRGSFTADHLTSATYRVTPSGKLRGATKWKLRVSLDMASVKRGSSAVASVTLRGGKTRVVKLRIKNSGQARKSLPFSAGKIKHIELTLANGGTQYRCNNGGDFSCEGTSKNDGTTESFRLQVLAR